MPAPSVDACLARVCRRQQQQPSGGAKTGAVGGDGGGKMLAALLEHTRSYIPLKRNRAKNELRPPVACNRRYAQVANRAFAPCGDAFLEPYMQGLSNDVRHAAAFDEVSNENCNVLKKRLQDEYLGHDDRTSSISSPVSLDTPLDERPESHFGLLAGSQGSLNRLLYEEDCSDSGSETSSLVGDEETKCDITLVERLIRSHPIWFLPGIQRAGAFHLLQGKEDGNFVVRKSSQNSTMAISVRLPSGKGPYIEHYLIQVYEDGHFGLESSDNKFPTIPLLIDYYCQCCDELPVQLTLPRAIREAKNRQKLTSLALLGQEFWRYPMANPCQSLKSENESPVSLPSMAVCDSNAPISNMPFSNSSSSNSPASSFSSSSFESNSSLPLDELSSPLDNNLKSTFKGSPTFSSMPYNEIGIPLTPENASCSLPVESSQQSQIISVRQRRPTPPNSLNLACTTCPPIVKAENNPSDSSLIQLATPSSKTPPPPPPRWTKPPVLSTGTTTSSASNFSVAATLTVSVNKQTQFTPPDSKSPAFQMPATCSERSEKRTKRLTSSMPAIAPVPLPRLHIPAIASPTSPSTVSESHVRPCRRSRRHKESHHYRESDVTYHKSRLADKASDYEDIWGPDHFNLTTFKPQPPPRSLPLSSFDHFSSNNVSTKSASASLLLGSSASPQTETEPPESPPATATATAAALVSPVSLPDMPSTGGVATKHRFGPLFTANHADPPVLLAPSEPAAGTPLAPLLTEPQTPVQRDTSAVEPKTGSPFYAEPADAIKQQQSSALRRRVRAVGPNAPQPSTRNRHSDPTVLLQWPPTMSDGGMLERIDSKEELITANGSFSTSVDNLVTLSRPKSAADASNAAALATIKPIDPPKVNPARGKGPTEIWPVDSSWEFFCKDVDEEVDAAADSCQTNIPCDNPNAEAHELKTNSDNSNEQILTVQEMIFQRLPCLRLSPVFNGIQSIETIGKSAETDDLNCSNASSNLTSDSNNNSSNSEKIYHNGLSVLSQISDTSDTQTEFSEPWDCSQWEHLLSDENHSQVNRTKSFKDRLDPLLSPPRLKALSRTREENWTPGATVRSYALKLAGDKETVFAKTIENFITCTKESQETRPQVVMRNMRQFMSGMKNYLVTHGEREFNNEVEIERKRLKSTEFLNLDAILEGVMHKLVVTPLKHHLYDLFVKAFEENGAIKALVENIVYARTKTPYDLGLKRKLELPSTEDLREIGSLFQELQAADSPLVKLECLLKAISNIFNSVKRYNAALNGGLGADDLLPIFVWVLVQTGLVSAEIEAEYMWGLLHPSLLSGEGGYYLTTLSSAVDVLKNFRHFSDNDLNLNEAPREPWAFTHVFKVLIPNELNGSLLTKTLPLRPNMTTKEICRIIALKLRITNPQDYSLYQLVEGEESPLNEGDYPQDIKSKHVKKGKRCFFTYKRIDAKIAWPNN